VVVDAGYLAAKRHIIYGLIELDVTQARQLLRTTSETSTKKISFTAFLVASLGRAIAAHPKVQAYRDWRGRLVLFDDVDVVTLIETEKGGVALPHIIRAAQRRTVQDISDEIRTIQISPAQSAQRGKLAALAKYSPRFVRLFVVWLLRRNPVWLKNIQGTAIVTSVGMFGKGGGWGIAFLPYHTLGLTVGGIVSKPGVYNGEIAIREYLHLTFGFDHDIVDGAPATRFAKSLCELIESAAVLEEEIPS
jgi:pyruvate/2-oxoglutarate dehydrogenase complex dihydrolipoamide acyltransferase (E2) component